MTTTTYPAAAIEYSLTYAIVEPPTRWARWSVAKGREIVSWEAGAEHSVYPDQTWGSVKDVLHELKRIKAGLPEGAKIARVEIVGCCRECQAYGYPTAACPALYDGRGREVQPAYHRHLEVQEAVPA